MGPLGSGNLINIQFCIVDSHIKVLIYIGILSIYLLVSFVYHASLILFVGRRGRPHSDRNRELHLQRLISANVG